MNIPLEYCAYGGVTKEDREKNYAIDLLEIVRSDGDCFNIPCYENDCPIFHWCHDRKEMEMLFETRKLYCIELLKEVPQDILFEVAL